MSDWTAAGVVALILFAFIAGVTWARQMIQATHTCVACRTQHVTDCGDMCGPCETSAVEDARRLFEDPS